MCVRERRKKSALSYAIDSAKCMHKSLFVAACCKTLKDLIIVYVFFSVQFMVSLSFSFSLFCSFFFSSNEYNFIMCNLNTDLLCVNYFMVVFAHFPQIVCNNNNNNSYNINYIKTEKPRYLTVIAGNEMAHIKKKNTRHAVALP